MLDAFHVLEKPDRVCVRIDCYTQSKLFDIFSQTIFMFNIYFINFQLVNLVRQHWLCRRVIRWFGFRYENILVNRAFKCHNVEHRTSNIEHRIMKSLRSTI